MTETMTETTTRERVHALNEMIQQGKIMEAMREFYADDVIMSENDGDATVGLAAGFLTVFESRGGRHPGTGPLGAPARRP